VRERGHLFVVNTGHEKVLEANYATQKSLGVKVELLGRAQPLSGW
jgi:hypothetical protein